ncbi:MAG: hypothetical protein GY801_20445 [bacterium]|nr:hypothetical protein [bacterium]
MPHAVNKGRHYFPKLDGVIVSHDHYDRLDYAVVTQLKKSGVPFYCPRMW